MPNAEQVLISHPDAAWLPEGGRADVVLAKAGSTVPSPTCVVRLLATRHRQVLAVPRANGRGLDIPTLRVGDGAVEDCLRTLMVHTLGGVHTPTFLGYVRNVVQEAPDDYPWPTPHAHFSVWHCAVPRECDPRGVWLDDADAETHLRDRHWWPLAMHLKEPMV